MLKVPIFLESCNIDFSPTLDEASQLSHQLVVVLFDVISLPLSKPHEMLDKCGRCLAVQHISRSAGVTCNAIYRQGTTKCLAVQHDCRRYKHCHLPVGLHDSGGWRDRARGSTGPKSDAAESPNYHPEKLRDRYSSSRASFLSRCVISSRESAGRSQGPHFTWLVPLPPALPPCCGTDWFPVKERSS